MAEPEYLKCPGCDQNYSTAGVACHLTPAGGWVCEKGTSFEPLEGKPGKGTAQRVAEVFTTAVFVCVGLIILILLSKALLWALAL